MNYAFEAGVFLIFIGVGGLIVCVMTLIDDHKRKMK